jgi:hypothetical protein
MIIGMFLRSADALVSPLPPEYERFTRNRAE